MLFRKYVVLLLLAFVLTASFANANELVIFSGRKEPLVKPVIELFEQTTGIEVKLKTGDSAALSREIIQQLPNFSADVFIGKESGYLEYMRLQGAFQVYESEAIQQIPAKYRATDGTWIGVSGRGRVLIFNTDLISREDVPHTLEQLMDPKWKGKIAAVNSSNPSLVAWVSALRIELGEKKAKALLVALKNNDIQLISKSHTDVRKSVGRGEYPLALSNHYYMYLQRREQQENLTHVDLIYLDQEEGGRGELINVAGAGIVENAKNIENAKKFMDFLTSAQAQKLFAEVNFEYPLLPGVSAHPEVLASLNCSQASALNCIKTMQVGLDDLGKEVDATMDLLDEVKWQ